MKTRRLICSVVSALFLVPAASVIVSTVPAEAKPAWTKNCSALNKKYVHGVGKTKAKDKTSTGKKVTTFKKSDKIYAEAMKNNKGLDRDKDGIACEKA